VSHLYIAFGTTDGHTATVVEALRQAITAAGHRVTVTNLMADAGEIPEDADGVIVAASLHVGQLQTAVKRFITDQLGRLTALPAALVTVCLAVTKGPEGRQEGLAAVETQLGDLGWQPTVIELVAGARAYAHYGFFKRLFMRWIASRSGSPDVDMSRSYVYTDFEALRRFGTAFAARVASVPDPAVTGPSEG
jgi:menaquinone-dependent protoporphyrinogen oxidase